MKIFLSWSGQQSKSIADIMYAWLPRVIQRAEPFLSSEGIEKGARWSSDLNSQLEGTQFGLICLTKTNLTAPWIQYEAGALSKSVKQSRVAPILFGVDQAELNDNPLVHFNNAKFDQTDVYRVFTTINSFLAPEAIKEDILRDAFYTTWPKLEQQIQSLLASQGRGANQAKRSDEQVRAEELLATTREILRRIGTVEGRLGEFSQSQPRLEITKLTTTFADALCEHSTALEDKSQKICDELSNISDDNSIISRMRELHTALGRSRAALLEVEASGASSASLKKAILELRRISGKIRYH